MTHYRSNLRDLEFNLFEVFGANERLGTISADAIGITPDAQILEHGILGVDQPVLIEIEFGERGETILDRIAKELSAIINLAILVAIENEQAILRTHPSRLLRKSIRPEIEIDLAVGERR